MPTGSSTTHTLTLLVQQQGIDQVRTSIQSLSGVTQQATTQIGALSNASRTTGPALQSAGSGANQFSGALGSLRGQIPGVTGGLNSSNILLGQNAAAYQTAGGSSDKYTTSTNKVTSSVLPLVGRVTGLSFAFTGLFAAMGEAQGMAELLALSQDKVNILQDQQTKLVNAGQKGTKAYTSVTNELEKAQRGLAFQQRVTNLSAQDQYFFIASIVGQLIPTAIKGYTELSKKLKDFGGGLSGVATLMSGSITRGFVGMTERLGLLPPLLNSSGQSANTFGMALKALALNPITILLTAATIALSIFVTNAFGARDAINAFGVWLGNAVPILRPFLELLGKAGDFLVTQFGGSINQVIPDVKQLTKDVIEMKEAFRGVLDLDVGGDTLTAVRAVNLAISELGKNWDYNFTMMKVAMTTLRQQANMSLPGMIALWGEYDLIVGMATAGSISHAEAEKKLAEIWAKIKDRMAGLVEENKAKNEETRRSNELAKTSSILNETQIDELAQVKLAIDEEMNAMGNSATVTSENAKIVSEWINQMGLANDITDEQILGLLENAQYMKFFGDNAEITEGKIFDLDASIQNYLKTQDEMKTDAAAIWEDLKNKIDTVGMAALPEVEARIEALKAAYPDLGKIVESYYKGELTHIEETQKGLTDLIDKALERGVTEEDIATKIAEAKAEVIKKTREEAIELGLLDDIRNLSLEGQQNAIKIYKATQEEQQKERFELQKLAVSRGMDLALIDQSNEKLRDYIKTHQIEAVTTDDVANAVDILIGKREEEQRQTVIDTEALRQYAAAQGVTTDTTLLSADAIQQLIDNHEALGNARQTAIDDVTLWQDALKLEQAEEIATTEELLKFAEGLGITVPEYIREKGIPAIKEFIEAEQGIGEGAKKAKEEALKAFEEIAGKAHSALEGIISDKLGEDSDNIKKALRGLEKVGTDMNSLTAKRHIIDIYLNDDSLENDLIGLGDVMMEQFGRLEDFTREEATQIGDAFTSNLISEVEDKSPATAEAVLAIWENIKANPLPGETGEMMVGRLEAAIANNDTLKTATEKLGKEGIQDPLAAIFQTTAQKTDPELVKPIIDAEGNITTGTETAIAPIEGVFSTAFLKATIAATGQINLVLSTVTDSMKQLYLNVDTTLADIKTSWDVHATDVQTVIDNMDLGFKTFSENVATYSTTADDSFRTFTENADSNQAYLATQIETGVLATFDTLVTNVDTGSDTMETAIDDFVTNAGEDFDQMIKDIDAVIKAVDKLIRKMEDLEEAAKDAAAAQAKVKGGGGGGGSTSSAMKSLFRMQHGGSFMVTAPTRVGNILMGEAGPEEVTVTPLTQNTSPIPGPPTTATLGGPIMGARAGPGGTGTAGSTGPIHVTVTGNHTTILKTLSGRVLAEETMPFLMSGSHSIT